MKRIAPHKMTDELRRIVAESGYSLGEVSRQTGIHVSQLSRFASGERFVSSRGLDALADFLGLRIVKSRKREGGK
jgi:transcriptional regulator with XRE-family HTH domain